MNYLAHLRVATQDADGWLGALLGDFMRGVDLPALRPSLRAAVGLHRAVDAFTDGHPLVRAGRARFSGALRHAGFVLVDVFHDHFLVRHWDRFTPGLPLARFLEPVHAVLIREAPALPGRIAKVAPRMARERWLESYGELENVRRALDGMAARMRRPLPLADGIGTVREHRAEFEREFLEFFPQLIAFARRARGDAREAPGLGG